MRRDLLPGQALTDAGPHLETALTFARAGNSTAARTLAETQIKAFPDEPAVLRGAAIVLRLCGDHGAALTLFRRALAIQQIEIAETHLALNQRQEALNLYRQAMEAIPDAHLAAAAILRDLGQSWAGLLLLEALYERFPQHIEGNRLRTEFLRYHIAHPEIARAADAESTDGRLHFRHMRALTEIADYRTVLTHAAQLTPPPGSDLAFHTAAFSGHAKLALAGDHTRSAAKALVMERSAAWLDAGHLTTRLKQAIHDRTPLSMIRVGDGEARFLALSDPWAQQVITGHEARCIVGVIWRNWFGDPIESVTEADLATLSTLFTNALANADILGVSTAQRYEMDLFHRGYLVLLEHAIDAATAARPGVSFTHAFANILLHQHTPFYTELLSGLDFLGCIGPHPGLAARLARHHGIPAHREYLVPGEARLPDSARAGGSMPHVPDRFRDIMTELTVPKPGAVFLVAAGLLGKIYCHRIRHLGGIAIDIGSVADAWTGFDTRPGLYQDPANWVLPPN